MISDTLLSLVNEFRDLELTGYRNGRSKRPRKIRPKAESRKQQRYAAEMIRRYGDLEDYYAELKRPKTRADCLKIERPCIYVGCKFNLYLDITSRGSINYNFPDLDPSEMPETGSCILDIVDEYNTEIPVEYLGVFFNLTRSGVGKLLARVMKNAGVNSAALKTFLGSR